MRLYSTEQVSKYHPDKYADQISDAILTACLREDPHSRVACECMVKDRTIVLGGEITTKADVNFETVARRVADKLHYKVDEVINLIGKQSPEIASAVDSVETLGAGDQGIMFGYATDETDELLPYGFTIANRIIKAIERDVDHNAESLLQGDAKTQVTVDLDGDGNGGTLHSVVVSVCHRADSNLKAVTKYVAELLKANGIKIDNNKLVVNPGGEWTVGGPIADCGLTGRKIVCDQYGGYTPVGGGAFSGKDPTKVDRSAAYMARHLAKRVVKELGAAHCLIQLGYVIGKTEPVSVEISTGDKCMDRLASKFISENFDLRPKAIIDRLDLLNVDYERVAEGCHYYGIDW